MPDPTTPLSAEEFASLKAVAAQHKIPKRHEDWLAHLGLIEQKLRGWKLTPAGEMRIAMGK